MGQRRIWTCGGHVGDFHVVHKQIVVGCTLRSTVDGAFNVECQLYQTGVAGERHEIGGTGVRNTRILVPFGNGIAAVPGLSVVG